MYETDSLNSEYNLKKHFNLFRLYNNDGIGIETKLILILNLFRSFVIFESMIISTNV